MANNKVEQIKDIRARKESASRRKLGELLVETGLLSVEDLTESLKSQKETGKRLGQIL